MGRRSHRAYRHRKVFPLPRSPLSAPTSTLSPHFALSTPSNHIEVSKPHSSLSLISSVPVEETNFTGSNRRGKAKRLRKSLQRIVGFVASLTWGISLLGYLVLQAKHGNLPSNIGEGLKGAVGCISVLQSILLVYYWRGYLAYLEVLREVMQPQTAPVPAILSSPKVLAACIAECCFHLFIFLPATSLSWTLHLFGTENDLSLDELCYLTVLLRNYHSLRLLYWYSRLSTLHTTTLVHLVSVSYRPTFVLRCFLVEYGLLLVLGAYGVMVLIPGVFEYIFEHSVNHEQLGTIWNDFWVVFYTQTTIGYGEGPPQTFFGQLMILISAVFGYFTLGLLNSLSTSKTALSLTECTLYSEIRYRHEKRHYLLEATVLIQHWWRLMTMRVRKKREVKVILGYFAQLRAYRSVLVSCTRVKDTRFERQITAFEVTVRRPLRSLQEYLSPVVEDRSLLIEVYRQAFSIKKQCIALCKLTQKYTQSPTPKTPSSSRTVDNFRRAAQSNQVRVRAKHAAFQNLTARLVGSQSRTKSAAN